MLVDGKGATCIAGVPRKACLTVELTHSKPWTILLETNHTHERVQVSFDT